MTDMDELKTLMANHLEGTLCENCRDLLEKIWEGTCFTRRRMQYLHLNLYDIIIKELKRLKLLGKYSLR